VSVLPGNGDGTFGSRTDYATIAYPRALAIADMNGDGWRDLIFDSQGAVSVMLNDGDGTFGPKSDYPAGSTSFSLAVADCNGDQRNDVVAATGNGSSVSVLLGNGDGSLGSATVFPAGTSVYGVAAGDLNADGRLDLAVTNVTSPSAVQVLLGDGAGGFGSPAAFPTGTGAVAVAIGDLNGDSRGDLVVVNTHAHTVSVLLNDTPTPILLSRFEARWDDGLVQVRWRFEEWDDILSVELERGQAIGGPWIPVESGTVMEGRETVVTDPDAVRGSDNFYRLVVTGVDGEINTFGPILVHGVEPPSQFALLSVEPTPSHGRVGIVFALPREAHVRLTILDLQGREIARVADRRYPAGRFQVSWDGANGGQEAGSGIYFVRYETPETDLVRKLIIAR
jgi:hypothetical protein